MNLIKVPKTVKVVTAVVAVLAIAPFALPAKIHLERATVVPADAATVYELVSSSRGFQLFNPWRDTDPALKVTLLGPDTGIGASFQFDGRDGSGTQTITALEKDRAVTMLIDLGPKGQPIQQFTLSPDANGTKVTWDLDANFGMNPIGRVIGLFMDGKLGSTWERGLFNLADVVKAGT